MQEDLDNLNALLSVMTVDELKSRLRKEMTRLTFGATFDTRLVTAIKARLTELGENTA